jgi:hypothetical protein
MSVSLERSASLARFGKRIIIIIKSNTYDYYIARKESAHSLATTSGLQARSHLTLPSLLRERALLIERQANLKSRIAGLRGHADRPAMTIDHHTIADIET